MKHELPELPYQYTSLEPFLDAQTMQLHYEKHHGGYVTKLNAALEKYPELLEKDLLELLLHIERVPESIRTAVNNNGWQHYNHSFYWNCMGPEGLKNPEGTIKEKINATFGSFDAFKVAFTEKAVGHFGSGWVWLVEKEDSEALEILATKNEENPLKMGKKPLLVLDVWEHAYYLKYQNRRNEFVEAWWNVVNWASLK
jgi:superoxide dismutase, Fe-Mn family